MPSKSGIVWCLIHSIFNYFISTKSYKRSNN